MGQLVELEGAERLARARFSSTRKTRWVTDRTPFWAFCTTHSSEKNGKRIR